MLQGNELNCEPAGSIRNPPIFVPLQEAGFGPCLVISTQMIQGSETLKCVQVLTGTVLHFIIPSVFQAMSFVAFIPPIPSSIPADGGVREQLHSLADYQD